MSKAAHRKESSVVSSAFQRASTQPADWAIHEFAHAQLPDRRHHRRLQIMATAFARKPTAPIPQACPNLGEAKGAYRFLENDRIRPMSIRQAHQEATLERASAHPVVLAVQDKTTLHYSTHPQTQGFGALGPHSPQTFRLLPHSSPAPNPPGPPPGR